MAKILHRISIDAPASAVHDLIASREGIAAWWTGREVTGDPAVGGRLAMYFNGGGSPAAVMEVLSDAPDEIVWRCVEGPADWLETRITFALKPAGDGATTLLFEHDGWLEPNEFMGGCTTNWGAYLTSLKSGAEGDAFSAYPHGEVSRWG